MTAKAIRYVAGRLGRDAPKQLRDRAEDAEVMGDDVSAETWREIAEAAEGML
jgi:hypothetical protein